MTASLPGNLRRRLGRSLISQSERDIFQQRSWPVDNIYQQKLDVQRSLVTRRLSFSQSLCQDSSVLTKPSRRPRSSRNFHSEADARSLDCGRTNPLLPQQGVPLRSHEALRFKVEARPIPYSNDAPAVEISTGVRAESISLPHEHPSLQSDQQTVAELLSTLKDPLQTEWENLWYHGVDSAYLGVAHHYPELANSASQSLNEQSISEPTLDISSLKKEEQKVFEQEERTIRTSFAPTSKSERLRRLEQARKTSDQREKFAVLLGLPTFAQYIEGKQNSLKEESRDPSQPSKRQVKRETRFALKKEKKQSRNVQNTVGDRYTAKVVAKTDCHSLAKFTSGMTQQSTQAATSGSIPIGGAEHRPLVVGLTKPQSTRSVATMASSSDAAALNKEIAENVKENTTEAAPAEATTSAPSSSKPKKEKAPKQPKPQKAAAPVAPTSPALIDLRVGHILRAIAHPNADSLYVSTIAMGDAEGTEHTQVDEETGKVVRTVCSGLNGLVPLEEMQDRKIVVVANLKPVNMRSIKSAAMVLAASPKQPEGADPHAPDRVVELVQPPEGSEAGDKVFFEGWPYGEGKGPEKVLNPKKKQWEAIQPGFYTSDDLVVAFDAGQCDEVDGSEKGNLVVEGKGACTVKTLKGAVVR